MTSYLAKMSHDGQTLLYSTYIGGENFSGDHKWPVLDDDQNIYLFGRAFNSFFTLKNAFQTTWTNDFQGFLMKFDPSGRNIIYSTFTPGYGGMTVDKDQNILMAGTAFFDDFPLKDSLSAIHWRRRPLQPGRVPPEASASGKTILFSTLLAGSGADNAGSPRVDASGAIYVTGSTLSSRLPDEERFSAEAGRGLRRLSDEVRRRLVRGNHHV